VAKSNAILLVGSSYNAGFYPTGAAANFAGNTSLAASNGTNSLTVDKASLTVSAGNKSRIYGVANPLLTAVYTGFVNNEGSNQGPFASSGVTGTPTLSTTATQFSPVGQYPITIAQNTLNGGSNYQLTTQNGTLTVYLSGVIGLQKITISGGLSLVDSYDSSIGYPASQSSDATLISNVSIVTSGGADVDGSFISGGSVNVGSGTTVDGDVYYETTLSNSGFITGAIYHQAFDPIVAPIPAPCGSYTQNPATWITGAYTYDAAKGKLTVSGGGMATMAAGSYCFSEVTVSGGSTLAFSGAVEINVTGKFTDSGGSVQNPSLIPFNLQVSSSYTGSNGVTVSGSSATYMSIYAPGTGVTVSGGGPFYGSLVGKTLTISGGSSVHQDLALPGWDQLQ
jgi:phage baseplate assembly protein gpV